MSLGAVAVSSATVPFLCLPFVGVFVFLGVAMGKNSVVVVLADGFEEIEAVVPIDVMRRAGLDVVVAGLKSSVANGSHGMSFRCDCTLSSVAAEDVGAVVLPGGMPGASNLHDSAVVNELVLSVYGRGGYVCAICASPAVVLAPLGILGGRRAVCYPGMEACASDTAFEKVGAGNGPCVIRDGNVITGAGPGCAFGFAYEIVSALCGCDAVYGLKESMVWEG